MKANDVDQTDRRAGDLPPVEAYIDERKAEFLLSNAVDADDYERAVEEVRRMGLDLVGIPHRNLTGG